MTKKIFILLISSLLLCSCENIETDTANETAQKVTEPFTFPISSYLDTSDLEYVGKWEAKRNSVYEITGDAGQTLIEYYDEYKSDDGICIRFDELNRLRIYNNEKEINSLPSEYSKDEMRKIADNVFSELIDNYEDFQYHTSYYNYNGIPYELIMEYETETNRETAIVNLNSKGEVATLTISYTDIPTESQIDHEYFNNLFENRMDTMLKENDYHHYTLNSTEYILHDNSVFALYRVTTYDNPIVEGSENPEDFPACGHAFGFAKSLE